MDNATIWNLFPGAVIRVVKPFRDCAGREFSEGTVLHFTRRDYLPYHNGHTVYFQETTMYLCDADDTSAIVRNRDDEYFELCGPPE